MLDPKNKIIENHYTRSWPSGKSYVYTYEDCIVVFSVPANCNIARWFGAQKNRVWELSRLWAPDGHRKNLLTEAISFAVCQFKKLGVADVLVSYADPGAGHSGGVYRAASWTYLKQSTENRGWVGTDGKVVPRRKFHSGRKALCKAEVQALGFAPAKLEGKHRYGFGLNRNGRKLVSARLASLESKV